MQIKFKEYNEGNKPQRGDICLCKCPGFCEEGVITAEYTRDGFVFSGHGNIDRYVTAYVVLDL